MPRVGPTFVADYLLPNLNEGTFGEQLEWVAKGERIFRMAWKHKNNSSWTVHDAVLFVEWDRLKDPNRHRPDEQEYYTMARQRMNATMWKLVSEGILQQVYIGPKDSKDFKYYKIICEKKPPRVQKKHCCQDNACFQCSFDNVTMENQRQARTMYIRLPPEETAPIERNDQCQATDTQCSTVKTSPVKRNRQCNASTKCRKKSSDHCLPDASTQCTVIKKTFRVKSDNQDQFIQVHFLVSPTVTRTPNINSNVSTYNKTWDNETGTILKLKKRVDLNQCIQLTSEVTIPVEKLFWCRFCEKIFKLESSLNQHHRKVHNSEPSFTEENCKKYSIKTELHVPVKCPRLLVTVPIRIDILHDIISEVF